VNADRFPGFDVLAQQSHWDPVTAGLVLERLSNVRDFRFFTPGEQAIATVLCDRLLGQHGDGRIPVAAMIDARLAAGQTDGWRYEGMPEDGQAWRGTLAALQADAEQQHGQGFVHCPEKEQNALIQAVQDRGTHEWHGLPADRVWSLWTRYACTAFYAHPDVWTEIGFPGPAYPRGYKNTGVDRREPFEVRDAHPDEDPLR
jgi:Gluconate 2-dehydrogenase subunit 3